MLLSWHWLPSDGAIILVGTDRWCDILQIHGNFSTSLYRSFAFSVWTIQTHCWRSFAASCRVKCQPWPIKNVKRVAPNSSHWLQHTFATETSVLTGGCKALSCSEGETFTAISFFNALLNVVYAVWGCCANVAPGSGGKGAATSPTPRSTRVAPKDHEITTRCRCSAELMTLDWRTLGKDFPIRSAENDHHTI